MNRMLCIRDRQFYIFGSLLLCKADVRKHCSSAARRLVGPFVSIQRRREDKKTNHDGVGETDR